jgi:hypothetical protein
MGMDSNPVPEEPDDDAPAVPIPEAIVAADWTVLGAIAAVVAALWLWRRRRRPAAR